MNIYERIKALRIKNGMSQYDLALKVGYEGRSAISKVEQGKRDISQSMIVKYADALGVTPAYLLYGDEEGENQRSTSQSTIFDERMTKFATLFSKLTLEQQDLIIVQIKGILNSNTYRMQTPTPDTIRVFKAARSSDNHAPEIVEMTREELAELENAPETDEDLM